jgi:cell wall assembly regulator SMI1
LKKKLGRLSLESFDQAPTGNVEPTAQPVTPPQPLVPTAGYSETPFSGQENYAAEEHVEADVKEFWQKLLGYWKHYGDDEILESLNPGANSGEISALESEFHVRLPEAFIALLKLANGQTEDNHGGWCFGHREFLGTQRIIEKTREWQGLNQQAWGMYSTEYADKEVKKTDWSDKWLIFGWSEDHKPSFLVLDFDPTHEGKMGQVVSIDLREGRRVVVAPDFLTWFKRFVTHLTTPNHGSVAAESHAKPPYPLRTALEADAMVVDVDDLDQLAVGANSLSSYLTESGAGMALESEKNPSDIAKSKMHLRFKKLKDGFVDTFRSAAGMASKYEKQLDELEEELLKGHTHGQIKVNMSHLWQHFSDEKGPITHNLITKVKEDVAFSTYILTVFSEQAYQELENLSRALHTGQGTDDEQAKRTALDVEKLKGPAEYMDQKWVCAAGEQPYLSVTGLSVQQGRHPRPVGIEGVSLDRLALLATPYHLREYGSFMHGLKKMFVSNSTKEVHMAAEDLAKLIVIGREYLSAAKLYLAIYNKVWPIFRRLDDSLDMIWDDFGLTDYEINIEGKAEDGSEDVNIQWQESETGNVKRRLVVFDQLMQVVRNFSDAVLQPGVNELARALRAAKFHGYLVAAGIKAAEGKGQHAGNVAQELFGFGKKEEPKPAEYASPKDKDIPAPQWDPNHPPSIAESWKAYTAFLKQEAPEALKYIRPLKSDEELKKLVALVKESTGKQFPADLIALWKLTDGLEASSNHPGMFDHLDFLTVHWSYDAYLSNLDMMDDDWADSDSKVGQGMQGKKWWEPWWIPFTSNGGGDSMCVDINPGSGGKAGQVIAWYHDASDRRVVAPSVAAYFALSVHRLMYLHGHKKDWDSKNGPKE